MVYCAEADSDPISETTLAVLSIPSTVLHAGQCLRSCERQSSGERQSEVMETASSSFAVVEMKALIPSLTDLEGGGMQVDEDLDDLEHTQMT